MQPLDLDELKTESILAVAKNMRLGHYGLQAHDEIAHLRCELEYAYRCVENGFVHGMFDFTVLRTRASNYLADLDGGVGARRKLLEIK